MKTQTEKILDVLRIVAWIALVGSIVLLSVKIAAFTLGLFAPSTNMTFSGTDIKLSGLRKEHLKEYIFAFSFLIVIAILNVQVWKNVKDVLYKINLKSPFSMETAMMLEKIGYFLLNIWIVGFIGDGYLDYLSKRIDGVVKGIDIDFNYLFTAGIVYIISQIFKRGVELQEENELTV
jgi:Protein of unknown function (DUF2975)